MDKSLLKAHRSLKLNWVGQGIDNKYKYQGQERQDELGLNWDSFKWRNYDYAIGRFMSIDPLTEEYNTWSPYTFSGNRVIDARELEGLEPHSVHASLQEASRNFSTQYNGYSIRNNVEVGTQFYKVETENGTHYSYTSPVQGTTGFVDPTQANDFPQESVLVGDGHTHGADNNFNLFQPKEGSSNPILNPSGMTLEKTKDYDIENGSNAPSGTDKDHWEKSASNNPSHEASYLYTPSGLVYSVKINQKTGKLQISVNYNLSKTNPSDPNSNIGINEESPDKEPEVAPRQINVIQN